mmetsp:Transcript_81299/g.169940  ORF Transcript_81299/g.169940 Transcript_81299/m.169940 type:complete len:189 (+) Transcript_81299:832-1398(+)
MFLPSRFQSSHILRWKSAVPRLLCLLLALFPSSSRVSAAAVSPAQKMLHCEACKTISAALSKDVKTLVEAEKMWTQKDLLGRIDISCMDPNLPSGAMQEMCSDFIEKYRQVIAKEVAKRWDENADEFEEGIVPGQFCFALGACQEKHETINEMIQKSNKKEKDLKEEREEKARASKRRKNSKGKGEDL